ncbi:hypothetical protein C493_08926 [Natronolimnohabitans innermongolicus JCM 12255]|uniref:Uncharacterized protein n=1 Tax=Natronolimnohabitans innermongolicus JCM 12255 TaxID=1227499 RepID=L9XAG6_9EURY|nr:hypothetical protein C493_08926 [Natronolimnohabitans innermongolicus JCM 12255]
MITTRGQTIRLGNETWENKLIDCRNGRGITIVVEGAATIRNVGLKGLFRGGSFIFSITNTGGTVTFENVYLGDGANKSGESFVHGPGAVFYHRSANCRVEFKRMNVQGFPNNGFYCSNTAHGGSVHWEDCYGKNNGVSTFRCAGRNDSLKNCVAYNDGTDYSTSNGSWGNYSESHGRPLWVWSPGTTNVEDCHFDAGSYPSAVITHSGGSVTLNGGAVSGGTQGSVRQNGVGSNPDLSVPEGVPTSAEEAAGGEPYVEPWTDQYGVEYIYEVENTSDEPVDYYLQVSEGGFQRLDYEGAVVDEDLTWTGDDKAAGRVEPGDTHCWGLDEWLVDVTIEDAANADARVNESASSLEWYPRDGADGDEWKNLEALLGLEEETDEDEDEDEEKPPEFTYEVEANEDDVEYFLEAKEGADFRHDENSELIYVSEDGTRAAGLLEEGETHAFTGYNVDAPAMLDVTIRGDGAGYVNDEESALGWYPRPDASGDDWKDLDELLDLDDQPKFTYAVEANEDDVEYFLEAKEGADFRHDEDCERRYVSEDGTRAAGLLREGETHEFTGNNVDAPAMLDVTIRGDGAGYVDGEESALGWYPRPDASGDGWKDLDELLEEPDRENTILIDGVGARGETKYEFRVSGSIESTSKQGASIDGDTEINGDTASGYLKGWRDAFAFSGDLESVTVDGEASVSVNGEEIDPSEYGDEHDHVLTLVGDGSETDYEISVDGHIETIAWDASFRNASIEGDQTAVGSIESGYQRFRYSGSITELSFENGSPSVYADRERLDPDDY